MTTVVLRDIAGYCPERALWQLVADLCQEAQGGFGDGRNLAPDGIIVDGDAFRLADDGQPEPAFLAPEHGGDGVDREAQLVWSIGALVCYAATGRVIFGGYGSAYQLKHPLVALPALPKEHRRLTPLVQRCLCADPAQRIALSELAAMARDGLAQCRTERPVRGDRMEERACGSSNEKQWPERMT